MGGQRGEGGTTVEVVGWVVPVITESLCRGRREAGSLDSLFLVDMIPTVFVIVDGLGGITGVRHRLLQVSFSFLAWLGPSGITLAGGDISFSSSFSSGGSSPAFFALQSIILSNIIANLSIFRANSRTLILRSRIRFRRVKSS